jgi:hypothetical protein
LSIISIESKKPYKRKQHGYYHEKYMDKYMQEDKGTQEDWEKVHKKALYWLHSDSMPLKTPTETRP